MSAPANNANGDANNNASEGAAGGMRGQAGDAGQANADDTLQRLLDMPTMVEQAVERTLAKNSARAEGTATATDWRLSRFLFLLFPNTPFHFTPFTSRHPF